MLTLPAPEGPRHAVLFRFVDGALLGRAPEPALTRRFGQLVARVHAVADRWGDGGATLAWLG